jgi:choline monooxygenase
VYTDPDVLRLEQERIFARSWHYVGHAGELAEPGDRVPAAAGDVPLVVVRGDDGELRGFVNVCRHRGSVLVDAPERSATIRCPYHAWTYGLDGRLLKAPRGEELDGDLAGIALREIEVGCWGPLVFANADRDAPPLTEALGELPVLAAGHGLDLDRLVFRERVRYELAANWKVAVENYLECYHCPVAHRSFSAVVETGPEDYLLDERDGLWSQYARRRDGPAGGQFHLLWPSFKLNVYPGIPNLSVGPLFPAGPESATGFLDYFFAPDADEREVAELLELDDLVGREDTALVESVQRGVRSGLLESGRLLPQSERLIAGFQRKVASVLGLGIREGGGDLNP